MITRRPRGDHELARFEVLPALWEIAPPASTQCRFCARQCHVLVLRSVSASVVWAMHRWLRGPMCECEASLEAGQTVWYCDSCYTCCKRDDGYIICSSCMGFGNDPFGHMVRVKALDSVRDTARVARQAFGFE